MGLGAYATSPFNGPTESWIPLALHVGIRAIVIGLVAGYYGDDFWQDLRSGGRRERGSAMCQAIEQGSPPNHRACALLARLLRSSLCCQKRAVVGDLWRWPRVEHCAKSAGNRVCPEASLRHENSVAAGRAHAARKAAQSEKARIVILRSAIEDLTRGCDFYEQPGVASVIPSKYEQNRF